ncbi:uncharacterized protein B0J16DRAFT_59281 [Fusarium flagelliforme]|uniref:Uncharacterized protein n=1 Tax=Fusarium flagelliforme TaxID=2675880 RepID=A0A395MLD1_9HYPO|nr:uncharacterized protein B0J16DRAFT_59281 [Fusarium flagelliforme]KAH7192406.1 hypothetical protein B0J16DRAFT_59281 [Fusarium flagelliforme]RFN48183.1 hypothetical protein FIE12Z_7634 [Fusarium flagelliforme]
MADNNPDPEPQQGAAEQPEEAKFCCVKLPALRKDYETQAGLEGRKEVLEPRLLDTMDPRWSSSFQEIVAPNNERFPRPDDNETASSETLTIDPRLQEATPPRKVFDFLSEPPKRPEIPEPRLANRWISERRLPPLQLQQKCWLAEDRPGQGPRLFYYTPTPREQENNGVAYPQNGQEPPDRWQYQSSPYLSPSNQSGLYFGNSEASVRRV